MGRFSPFSSIKANTQMDTQQALYILGLDPNPSPAQLKQAYREQVRLWHPDRYSNGSALKKAAERHIQDANLAYAFLKRNTPAGPTERPLRRPDTPNPRCAAGRSSGESKGFANWRRILPNLHPYFTRIKSSALLEWLRHDTRTHFRPWYRYPDSAASASSPKKDLAPNFGQILQNTLLRSSDLKRLYHKPLAEPSTDGTDAVAPVSGIIKPRAVKRR